MYFAAEEVANAPVPNGYSLCFVPNLNPVPGDVGKPWKPLNSLEEAQEQAGETLKDPKKCVIWFPNLKTIKEMKIPMAGLGKAGGTFFLGTKICKAV